MRDDTLNKIFSILKGSKLKSMINDERIPYHYTTTHFGKIIFEFFSLNTLYWH